LTQYLDIIGVIVVVIDQEARVQLINKKGSEILGYKEEDILGKNWFNTFLPENVREDVKTIYNKLMKKEIDNAKYYENEVITKSGEKRLIAWSNTILQDKEGTIRGTLCSGEDITEKKQLELDLRERVKELTCLYTASDIFTDFEKPLENVMNELLSTIQKAFFTLKLLCQEYVLKMKSI